ncbi:MAG: hypothetical protein JWQ98_3624 [Chlorobi bacterium]|nr:hypothetical protein [Chlorobiota bacterium]
MSDGLFDAWRNLEERAREIIRSDRRYAETDFLIQLLAFPSFEPFVSWEISRRSADSSRQGYFALRTEWNRPFDEERLRTPLTQIRNGQHPVPTIEMEEFDLTDEYVATLIGSIRDVSIPPFPEPGPFGIDGTSYEFYFHESFASARYAWWVEPPASWKPLGDIFRETLGYLNGIRREMG